MLGGERIPPPLPRGGGLGTGTEIQTLVPSESRERVGKILPGSGRGHSSTLARNRAVGGTAPPRVARAGGGGSTACSVWGNKLLAPAFCNPVCAPGLEVF